MPKVIGSLAVIKRKLGQRIQQAREAMTSAVAGYIRPYATIVHEDLDAAHAPGKTAKYLEQPLRQNLGPLASLIGKHYLLTQSMEESLLTGCRFIMGLSQPIVPVDTGALQASGFVAKEVDEEDAAMAAHSRAEAIHQAAKGKR